MDLDSYAEKLATNATFLLCKSSDLVVGAIVFYPNSSTSIIYIPLVWVDNDWRGQRIAKNMFMSLLQYGDSNKFKNIDLEVLKSNKEARCLYSSLGFSILEDRQSKFLLRLPLSNKDEKNE
ncbi:MAG: GNAT family N-acetyltransferase [Muribaculaceae bacterium]|nr:GNAT family N-acetyltransferase [Muribaculaceae bacterium]